VGLQRWYRGEPITGSCNQHNTQGQTRQESPGDFARRWHAGQVSGFVQQGVQNLALQRRSLALKLRPRDNTRSMLVFEFG
jgi:hypothetical protein